MAAQSFDLLDILQIIRQRKRTLIIITVIAAAIGAGLHLVRKKKYMATVDFIVNNPLYGDRSNLFRSTDTRYIDYFGGDDDLDKVTAFANSDSVRDRIIRNSQLAEIYNIDISVPANHTRLMKIFDQNFKIKRTEYKDMEISYTAYKEQDAANIANMSVEVIEEVYRNYYNVIKNSIYTSINDKVTQLDSSINALTDTLAEMRDQYGIYNVMSPGREHMMSGDNQSHPKGYGRAMEMVQNIESIKDQYVTDRAHYMSTLNEFSATTDKAMRFINVLSHAEPPTHAQGLSGMVVVAIAGFIGFICTLLFLLMTAYYNKLKAAHN